MPKGALKKTSWAGLMWESMGAGPMGSYTGKPFVGPGLCCSRTCLTTLLENLSPAVLDNAAFVVLLSCSI